MPRRVDPDPLSLAIGTRIRRLREARGLTLEGLAVEAGVGSKGYLSDLEKGLLRPTVHILDGLARRLGAQLADLVADPQHDLRGALLEASRMLPLPAVGALLSTARTLVAATDRALAGAGVAMPAPFEYAGPEDARTGPAPTVVPLLPLDVAARGLPWRPIEGVAWVRPRTTRALRQGHFVARVVGRAMEPRVPEGHYALFAAPVTGNLRGRVLLVRRDGAVDVDTGASFALRRLEPEDDVQEGRRVRLVPENPSYPTVVLAPNRGDSFEVVAELVDVLPDRA